MDKITVSDLAKELKVSTKLISSLLTALDMTDVTANTVIADPVAKAVSDVVLKEKAKKAAAKRKEKADEKSKTAVQDKKATESKDSDKTIKTIPVRQEPAKRPAQQAPRAPRPASDAPRQSRPRPDSRPTGDRRPAQAGDRRPAQAGDRRPPQAGDRRPAQAGDRRPAQAGGRRPAQAVDRRAPQSADRRRAPDQRSRSPRGQQPTGARADGRVSRPVGNRPPVVPPPPPQVAQQQTTPTKMVKKDHKYSDERYRSQNRMFSSENERSQRSSRRTRNTRTRPRGRQRAKPAERIITTKVPSQIELGGSITVKGISDLLKTDVPSVIKKLMGMGVMAAMNQEIDLDTATLLAQEFGSKVVAPKEAFDPEVLVADIEDKEEDLMDRAPVVTVMGHVDHGKTSLLDAIRSTNVVSREAGGITQHIGAHTVEVQDKKITFLDTPGHEAFTMMRARGAQVTDIAILVVAADDGVMPQTIEAINHAKNADVPIVVAINKIDRPQAQPERVKQELTEHGLIAEEWGGDTIMVNVSALRKEGIELLLESVILLAEILELKANPKRKAVGTVIEAKLDKGRGPVASVLVHKGTLRIGDTIVVGRTYGRVRAMVDDKGQRIEEAGPSTPVEVLGLNEVPDSSDTFNVVDDERQARQLAETRASNLKLEEQRSGRVTLEDLFSKMSSGEVKELNIILKADVHGSVEAIRASLERLSTPEIRVNIVHTGVGAVSESDVMLASASNAIIFGFNVRPDLNATKVAEAQEVDIRTYRVIYEIVDDVEAAMKGMLAPVLRERVIGHVEIRDLFKISRLGTIAGCYVNEGRVTRNSMVRVIRDGTVIHEGAIESLRRIKDDVREVATGYECGIMLERFNDIKVGDRFEVYINEEIRRTEL